MRGRLGTGGEVEEVVGDRGGDRVVERRSGGSGEISSASCVEIEVSSEIETSSAGSERRSMSPAAIRRESAMGRGGCAVEAALRPEGARWVRASEVRRAYGLKCEAAQGGGGGGPARVAPPPQPAL